MMDKFNGGLHYPTNAEKDELAQILGVASESVSRWFERTRKEKGVQRTRKIADTKPIPTPQYHPIQPIQQSQSAGQAPALFPPYGQFPSTYPYNTINQQYFTDPSFTSNIQTNAAPTTVNPSAGMYAPIPFIGQSLRPGIQTAALPPSQFQPPRLQVSVEVNPPASREGVYMDDTRNVKRAKIEPKRTFRSLLC
jgi:hypothetical protein